MRESNTSARHQKAFSRGYHLLRLTGLLASCACVAQAAPQTRGGDARAVTVGDAAELAKVLKQADPPAVVLLKPGDWDRIKLTGIRPERPITIRSAVPSSPAVIRYLSIGDSQGLRFVDITFNVRPGSLAVGLSRSSDIRFDQLNVHGILDGDPTHDGGGMTIRNTNDVAITNSFFHDLTGGITFIEVKGIKVQGNRFELLRSDGIHGTRVSQAVISGNAFTNFHPVGPDHPDAVQFWTTGPVPMRDIRISDNQFVRGDGKRIQGIFLGDESGAGYENVQITGNAILGGMYHGIRVVHGVGVLVADNLVLGYRDMVSWIMIKDSEDVSVRDNRATGYIVKDYPLAKHGNRKVKQPEVGDISELQAWRSRRAAAAAAAPGGNSH